MTREQIAKLLRDIGPPGENQDKKLKAVKDLKLKNPQGYGIEQTLTSYKEY